MAEEGSAFGKMKEGPATWQTFSGFAFLDAEVALLALSCVGSDAVSGRVNRPGADSEKRKIRPKPLSLEVPVGFCSEKFTSFHCPPAFQPPEQLPCPEADFGAGATPAYGGLLRMDGRPRVGRDCPADAPSVSEWPAPRGGTIIPWGGSPCRPCRRGRGPARYPDGGSSRGSSPAAFRDTAPRGRAAPRDHP